MNDLSVVYPNNFFKQRHRLNWRAGIFCPPIKEILQPKTLIDVGCATGDFVRWFYHHGIDAYGLEGSIAAKPHMVIPPERIFFHDIRQKFNPPRKYDLAMSIEVAEHIEPDYAEAYVENMVGLSELLLLTIAGPGQLGHSHVNLQPIAYWNDLFAKHNYAHDHFIKQQILEELEDHRSNRWIRAIIHNLTIYRKNNDRNNRN